MKKLLSALLVLPVGVMALAALRADDHEKGEKKAPAKVHKAVAILMPASGSGVRGTVVFEQKGDHVEIRGTVVGLTPGKHGFHVHEFGDTTAADGTSAGGHFNPDGDKHGSPEDAMRHAGDLGNIDADEDGKATFTRKDMKLELNGPRTILGRGLVVHAKADDFKTQPTGDAGGRVAVGVIGVANMKPAMKK